MPEQGLRPVGGEQAFASAWLPRPTARSIARKGPRMAKGSPLRLLLIVTGSTLRAEEMDRPLGYYLKQRIEQALSEAAATGRRGLDDYLVRVVADFRWIHDEPLQTLPTISLGGRASTPWRIDGWRMSPSRWLSASGTSSRWTPT